MKYNKVEKILKNTITKLINHVHELELENHELKNIETKKDNTDYEELQAKYRYTANELFKAREEITLLKQKQLNKIKEKNNG